MSDRTPNWQELDLNNQCGVCIHYQQLILKKETARGNCKLNSTYKQRTESCLKYKSNGGKTK